MNQLLIRGARGGDIAALRQVLVAKLGADAAAFGSLAQGDTLDADCEAAARRWQSGVGLIADGVIGPRCQELLGLRQPTVMAVPLSLATVRALFPATKPANIDRHLPYVTAALAACGLTDRPMIVAALGTIRAESEGFLPISELPSQFNTLPGQAAFSAYEGRIKGLGNNEPGDGARFKGRGFVQLTGRANYEKYGSLLDIALVEHPDWANAPEVAALLLARFLADCAKPMRADIGTGDLYAARKRVNGGSHGLDRFKDVFRLAASVWPEPVVAARGLTKGRRKAAPGKSKAAPKRRVRGTPARKDPADLRDRPYVPPPQSLYEHFPSDADVRQLLPVYTGAGLIRHQGEEGACTGFGLACVINYLRWRKARTPAQLESVSPRMLYNFARRYDEYAGDDTDGSSCRGALKGWFHHGVCLESDWPYDNPSARPSYGYAQRAAQHTLGVYYRVDLGSITDLQAAIQQVGAVLVSSYTHAGWDAVPQVARAPKGHADLPLIAWSGKPSQVDGHAFALVGFNARGFVVQNSWGSDWGVGGFAVLGYDDWLANAMDAWVAALGVPGVVVGRVGAASSASSGLAGGAANTPFWWSRELAYRHSVVLGNDGRVKRYLTEDEINRNLLHQVAGLPDAWFRGAGHNGPRKLVLYAHGGLNSEDDAIQRARALGRHFVANGCYPIFVVWKTGLLETIGNVLREAWGKQPQAHAGGVGEWIGDRTDLLIEKAIGRPLARPFWSEMKENAELAFGPARGGDHLITALDRLADTWGEAFELHLVGHSAGAIWLGHLLSRTAQRNVAARITSVHLYAPACTVAFANRHYAPDERVMQRLHLDLLSDEAERSDSVAAIYRKSLLYLVSNALEADPRSPLLGLANVLDERYAGWDGTSVTNDALKSWRMAASRAKLKSGDRVRVAPYEKVRVARDPERHIAIGHGSFDNDLEVVTRTLERIVGAKPKVPPDDLRGF